MFGFGKLGLLVKTVDQTPAAGTRLFSDDDDDDDDDERRLETFNRFSLWFLCLLLSSSAFEEGKWILLT